MKIYKFFVLLLFFYLSSFDISYSETIKKFNIKGNERVSDETIIMFSNLEIGDNIDQDKLNSALKELYKTNYFKNIFISNSSGNINIDVIENPIIQLVEINGIDDKKILENLKKVTAKQEKYPFIETDVNEKTNLLKNLLKSFGYYFVKLNTSIITNNNNTIDLIYDFELGEIAKIKKIKFIGDKIFRDSTLRNVIVSEEDRFWKFITRNKYLDFNRINLDVSRLENFYKNRGFYNVNIKSTTAIITDKNQFELIFNINADKKFYFDQVIIKGNDNIPDENISIFKDKFKKLKGKK